MIFEVKVPIYRTRVYFLVDEPDHVVTDYVKKKTYGEWTGGIPMDVGVWARVLLHESRLSFIRLPANAPISCVVHELMHVTFSILRQVNMEYCFESEEAYTYLMEYLVEEYETKIKKYNG